MKVLGRYLFPRRRKERQLSLKLKICDFTTRLPGPLAGALLADLGAQVTKVELEGQEDPFLSSQSKKLEPAFPAWSENLNRKKTKVKIDPENEEDWEKVLNDCDIALCPPNKRFERLKNRFSKILFIEVIGGRGKQKYLHDLNALFLTRSFQMHLKNQSRLVNQSDVVPPYLPFAGIVFAQQIALEALAGFIEKGQSPDGENKKIYLDESAQKVLDKLWSEGIEKSGQERFLHTGKYPCYNIYKTKDSSFVGLAAVEEKFWRKFTEIFNLPLSSEDRYDETRKTGQMLKEMFLSYKASEIIKLIGDKDICVNVFPNPQKEQL